MQVFDFVGDIIGGAGKIFGLDKLFGFGDSKKTERLQEQAIQQQQESLGRIRSEQAKEQRRVEAEKKRLKEEEIRTLRSRRTEGRRKLLRTEEGEVGLKTTLGG